MIDLRALALWRITLALTVLVDIVFRWIDIRAFYTDQGVLSTASYLSQSWQYSGYHLFLASGSPSGVSLLFLVWTAAAVALLIGYKTRLAAFLTWYFVVSIQLRNPLISYVSDDFLRVCLFWAPFLPLAARWSLEAKKHPKWQELPQSYSSLATAGILLQLVVLFFFMAYLKAGDDWLKTKSAVYFILANEQVSTKLGQYLTGFPQLLKYLTSLDLFWEYAIAGLILLGVKFRWARNTAFAMGTIYFLSLQALLNLGLSSLVGLASITVLTPKAVLEKIDKLWARSKPSSDLAEDLPPAAYKLEWPLKALSLFMIVMITIFNIYSVNHHHKIPPWSKPVMEWTFEQQHWHIFAANPFHIEGWFVFEIEKADGSKIDGFDPSTEIGKKPRNIYSRFPNYRWAQWLQILYQIDLPDNKTWRAETLNFLASEWSRQHKDIKPKRFRLIWMRKTNSEPGAAPIPIDRVLLAEQVATQQPERDFSLLERFKKLRKVNTELEK